MDTKREKGNSYARHKKWEVVKKKSWSNLFSGLVYCAGAGLFLFHFSMFGIFTILSLKTYMLTSYIHKDCFYRMTRKTWSSFSSTLSKVSSQVYGTVRVYTRKVTFSKVPEKLKIPRFVSYTCTCTLISKKFQKKYFSPSLKRKKLRNPQNFVI